MPLYDFSCPRCGTFVVFRSIENRDAAQRCPQCASRSERHITAPNLCLMSAPNRKAHAINERSAHEPRVRTSHACSSSCGCGSPKSSSPRQKKPKRNQRPWMLGH